MERELLPRCTPPCRHDAVRFGAEVLIYPRKWLVFTPPLTDQKIHVTYDLSDNRQVYRGKLPDTDERKKCL